MVPYFDLFPEKRATELRTATVPGDEFSFPAGSYLFTEYYCADLTCDCQRLLVKVLYDAESRQEEVATINYSWNEAPDASWKEIIGDDPNPFLDPFHRQADYANDIMGFWYEMLCFDQEYAERLKRHYAELRRVHGQPKRPAAYEELSSAIVATVAAEKKRRHRALRQKQKKRRGRRR